MLSDLLTAPILFLRHLKMVTLKRQSPPKFYSQSEKKYYYHMVMMLVCEKKVPNLWKTCGKRLREKIMRTNTRHKIFSTIYVEVPNSLSFFCSASNLLIFRVFFRFSTTTSRLIKTITINI